MTSDELAISVRSQVREPDAADVAEQPVRWEVVGSQSGKITLDPHNGRLRLAEYTVPLDAEATFEMDGNTVSRPMVSVVKMTVGDPRRVAQEFAGIVAAGLRSISRLARTDGRDGTGQMASQSARELGNRRPRDCFAGRQRREVELLRVQRSDLLRLRVDCRCTKLTVYIDNKEVASCDDRSDAMRSGHIILQGSPEGVIRYRDVRVRPL